MATAVSTAISNIINLWYVWLPLGIIIFVFYIIFVRKKGEMSFKPFVPVALEKTLNKRLKSKMDLFGQKFAGSMFISYNRIGRIERYYKAKGTFEYEIYDEKTKEIKVDKDKNEDYDLLVCEKVSDFPLWRFFGLFREYIILQRMSENKKEMFKIDVESKRIFIFEGIDLTSYGKVWINTDSGLEYLNNISTVRTLEQTKMHLENLPDKFAHLEMEQAKKERINKVLTDLEKSKYKERETAGDTTIN